MPSVRQASFAGGELDSLLYGRTDHPRYPSGLRKCSNFLVAPQGALKNRPGTKYVAAVKDVTISPRLVPFLWPSQNYVLEIGVGYIRFISNGAQVIDPATNKPLEVATPFTALMLPYLKFAQKDATLTICYGGQDAGAAAIAPQELKRVAHTNWTLAAYSVGVTPVSYTTLPLLVAPAPVPDATHQGSQWDWRLTQLWRNNTTGNVLEAFTGGGGILSQTGLYNAGTTYAAGDLVLASDGSGNTIIYTSLVNANLGNTPSTSPTQWGRGLSIGSDRPQKIKWVDGVLAGYTLIGHNAYRGRPRSPTLSDGPSSFGLVGFAEASATQFLDDGASPDYTQNPPAGTDPFVAPPANDYAAVVAHFQQRRAFARRPQGPARLNFSKTGQPSNFDTSVISQETDALDFTLASQAIDEIRSLVSLKALIALTQTGATIVRGGQSSTRGVALSPSSVDATKQSQRGASWVDPVVVDNIIVFIQAKGSSVRALAYDPIWETLGNPGNDLAIVAQHFLRARTAVDMAYQEAPDSIIWIVRDDGLLLGMTFVTSNNPDQQVYGWHQHSTDGNFEHVSCVAEATEDAAYFVVKRTINGQAQRYIERLQSRVITDVRLGVFLDAALTFDGRNTGATTMKFTSDTTYAGGEEGTILASVASFTPDDVGSVIVLVPDGIPAVLDSNGKIVTPAVPPVRCTIIGFTDTTRVRAQLAAPLTAAFQNVATTSWGFARRRFTNLGHLEGKTLTALGDGAVATAAKQDSSLVVTAGQITVDEPAVIVHTGLGYTAEMELLDVAGDRVRTAQKAQYKVVVEVVETRGLWIAESGGKFWEKRPREVSDSWGNPQLATRQEEVAVSATWNVGARAVVQARDPLPVTLVAATRELVLGGK